jgi:hypothetical protein
MKAGITLLEPILNVVKRKEVGTRMPFEQDYRVPTPFLFRQDAYLLDAATWLDVKKLLELK